MRNENNNKKLKVGKILGKGYRYQLAEKLGISPQAVTRRLERRHPETIAVVMEMKAENEKNLKEFENQFCESIETNQNDNE